jgi:two-component system OmpR family response regulator/two-component system alkaline phosphatase synthesis response regulator PhoP
LDQVIVTVPWPARKENTWRAPATATPKVLVVDEEAHSQELVCLHLAMEGYACDAVSDGRSALARIEAERFDLLVVDVMVPGLDGLSLCRAVRNGRLNQDVPILMMTAQHDELHTVGGLESGADDYVTKPFGIRELVARSRALLRRPRRTPPEEAAGDDSRPVRVRDVEIDPARRRVRVDGRPVELTDQEFRMLHLLMSNPGIVFSREALLARIWRGNTFVTIRSVDTLVKRLRRRIEPDPAQPRYLITVWGVGYKFSDT